MLLKRLLLNIIIIAEGQCSIKYILCKRLLYVITNMNNRQIEIKLLWQLNIIYECSCYLCKKQNTHLSYVGIGELSRNMHPWLSDSLDALCRLLPSKLDLDSLCGRHFGFFNMLGGNAFCMGGWLSIDLSGCFVNSSISWSTFSSNSSTFGNRSSSFVFDNVVTKCGLVGLFVDLIRAGLKLLGKLVQGQEKQAFI